MVGDLWNDNRRLEGLLKTEVGATNVALGTASPACVCVLKRVGVCVLSIDFIFSVGIRSYNSSRNLLFCVCRADLFTLLLCNYRKTQTVFTAAPACSVRMSYSVPTLPGQAAGDVYAMMCGLRSWSVGWNCDVWFERLLEIWVRVADSQRGKTCFALCSHIHPINLSKGWIVKLWQKEGRRGKIFDGAQLKRIDSNAEL